MSRKTNPRKSATGSVETDRDIDAGIDAVNRLRRVMREAGLLACADALDEAFACCLSDYVTWQDEKGVDQASDPETDPEDKLN
ncbi:hypothetical protein [Asticcacaulis benevestitus]|uniref:Uncharacterized protein n=1 Tax=Asticcacaulis benevestitus DSM 16100 = ATCC BAA-896 TaxID=1121022 RepID=V4P6R4_9CAUL|nr:hypothetical protein [Asticcacaulis benevestitus]ESQ83771.1 hypothetical protein ABENE_20070 [Asticcacaulis benevestitus DSM 16100 = ATCC BAA-896]